MKLKDHITDETLYVEIGSLVFTWEGGPYIDILYRLPNGNVEFTDLNINTWDYETSKSRLPFTPEALIDTANEWIEAYGSRGA